MVIYTIVADNAVSRFEKCTVRTEQIVKILWPTLLSKETTIKLRKSENFNDLIYPKMYV